MRLKLLKNNKMAQIFFSTSNCSNPQNNDISTNIEELLKLGIKNIEISSGHKYEKHFFEKINNYCLKNKIKILLHNYSPPDNKNSLINLSDPDEINRRNSINFIKKRIILTKKLKNDYYSFHGGFSVYDFKINKDNNEKKIINKDYARKKFIESLEEIILFAEKENINIGFENHVVEEKNKNFLITYSQKEIKEIFGKIKSKNLFLHLDAGHLNVTANTYNFDKINFIKTFRNKIIAIHISKNNGIKDEHKHIDKNFWLIPYLNIFKNLKYIIFETNGPTSKEKIKFYKDIIK